MGADVPGDGELGGGSAEGVAGPTWAVRRYVEQMPMGMLSLDGEDLRIVVANASYRASTARPDLVGKTVREAFPEAAGQGFFEMLDRVRTTGEAATMPAMRAELDVDGSGTATEFYFETWLTPALDDAGRSVGVHAQIIDVTARVQAETQALARARLAEQKYADALSVVRNLQDALLPAELPVLPRLDVAARYLLAGADDAAGGDWFDAVVRPDGSVALAVGDVVGHGVLASAVMGQLRAVLHDRLLSGESIGAALAALDRYAGSTEGAPYATVCVLVVDPQTGDAEYCTAGHPPPLVAAPEGDAQFLPLTGAGPLTSGAGFATRTTQLPEDATVMLYSDGLVERPGRPPGQSTVEILDVVGDRVSGEAFPLAGSTPAVERLCEEVLEILTRVTGHDDDITVLAAQRTPARRGFAGSWPAQVSTDSAVREEFGAWLAGFSLTQGLHVAVVHAVSELVANAIRHAYRDAGADGPGATVRVRAAVDDQGVLECTVTDQGTWRPPDPGARSSGLAMVRSLVDHLELDHGPAAYDSRIGEGGRDGAGGTRARFRLRLGREARLVAGRDTPRVRWRDTAPSLSVTVDGSTVAVVGPVDLVGSAHLAHTLATLPLVDDEVTVDLSAVTHLGSAGLRVLQEHHSARAGGRLRLLAPNGSVAQQILHLVQLPLHISTPE